MAAIASFSVWRENGQMPTDSQTPKTYIYQVSREFWKKHYVEKINNRQLAAILIIGGKLKI